MYRGTYRPNRRPVYTTAPDCLVYVNGELSLPSGANPNRRVDLQPFINSVSVNAGIEGGSGSASLNLHIPAHHMNDLYSGGRLALTTMMEVKIYMKGHFTVGGAPRFYPVFWGVVTSVNESYSAGEHTVSLSCSDMLHWWSIQQVNLHPSFLEARQNQQQNMNLTGNVFTGKNPFSVMHTLSRRVSGDSMNVQNSLVPGQHFRSEANRGSGIPFSLQAYWALRLGRVANSLRMYGPTGKVLRGDVLDFVLDPSRFRRAGKSSLGSETEAAFFDAFAQGNLNFAQITPFSKVFSQLGAVEISSNTFETKMNLANMVKESIGYEFYMDVTGEIIFKPPFYNMDVRPNYPVSWLRDVDIIDWNFAENEPDVTFLEATGFRFANREAGLGAEIQPHASYVDYRLVQKYGWRPGSFSSEFVGSDDFGGPKALFYHLVDVLDRQNARVNNGTATIPLRPELRLGYPVYVEGRDAYYYVESLSHTFSYGSRCTTQVTLQARRQKFYGSFDRWANENQEPKPGDVANPGIAVNSLYKRDIDPVSGTPEGDRNVIMTYLPDRLFGEDGPFGEVEAFEAEQESDTKVLYRNLVNLRSQFGTRGANKYVYVIDPNRDETPSSEDTGERQRGPVQAIESNPDIQIDLDAEDREVQVNAIVLPVSDERGYEVIGSYEYGRRVTVTSGGFVFDKQERDVQVESLLHMRPDHGGAESTTPDVSEDAQMDPTTHGADPSRDSEFMIDPNNYGRVLAEVVPPNIGPTDLVGFAQTEAAGFAGEQGRAPQSGPSTTSRPRTTSNARTSGGTQDPGISRQSQGRRSFRYNSNVGQWRSVIREERAALGLTEEEYPDETLLAIIHIESSGDPYARRTNDDGELSQFVGLMQVGKKNAADVDDRQNTDFMGEGRLSIEHYLRYQERYRSRHGGDPQKQAMLWKGGPSFLSSYNRVEASGATPQELEAWLAGYPPSDDPEDSPWGIDEYASQMQAAREVWEASLTDVPDIDEDLPIEDAQDIINSAISDAAEASSDQAEDPIEGQIVNVMGIPNAAAELRYELELFEQKLQESRDAGIVGLPAGMKPPRDPSVAPVVREYLQELYASAFGPMRKREEELRGHSRKIPRPPNAASIPTSTPDQDRKGVDTPLGRKEVRDALDRGDTYNDLFAPGGVIEKLMGEVQESATLPDDEDE